MSRFIIRRIAILPFALLLVHFLAFSYAYVARPIRAAHTPYYNRPASNSAPLLTSYLQHLQAIFNGALLRPLEVGPQLGSFAQTLGQALVASLGLLTIVLGLSVVLGFILGLLAVRNQPPSIRPWMSLISTVGLSMPSFYIGSLCILIIIFARIFVFLGPTRGTPIPISGFGWDSHLILPVISLMIHPTVKIAQVTAHLLEGELRKQYIIAARSFGHTWRRIRWRQAMRNVITPIILSIAGSFRMLMGELVVVEWLFGWPGLGNLLGSTLVPSSLSTELGVNVLFLDPPTVAGVLTVIAALFMITDLLAQILGRIVDPRLRSQEEIESGGVPG
jgi:ABC-type dipeptide/oligopeptide/nickel transport system permease component